MGAGKCQWIVLQATNWYTDGVMVSNISHSGVMTQIRRDALRREVARIDGRGNVTRTEYDALGRVAATIDALTNATTYAYDAMNRVAAITNALGHATVYEYDHRGNKTYEGWRDLSRPLHLRRLRQQDDDDHLSSRTRRRRGTRRPTDNGRHDTGRHDGRARRPLRAAGRHDDMVLRRGERRDDERCF